jgi:hypothetical protein
MKIRALLMLVVLVLPLYAAAQMDGVEYDWQEKKISKAL